MEVDLSKQLPNGELSDCCCNALLNLLPEELQPAMAQLALDSLDELAFKSPPSEPYTLADFKDNIKDNEVAWKKKSEVEKDKIRHHVFTNEIVAKYLDEVGTIQSRNIGNALTLEKYIRIWLEWDEKESARKCWVVYAKYPDTLEHGNCTIWRKKKEFV